jgi:hypothetical protein
MNSEILQLELAFKLSMEDHDSYGLLPVLTNDTDKPLTYDKLMVNKGMKWEPVQLKTLNKNGKLPESRENFASTEFNNGIFIHGGSQTIKGKQKFLNEMLYLDSA